MSLVGVHKSRCLNKSALTKGTLTMNTHLRKPDSLARKAIVCITLCLFIGWGADLSAQRQGERRSRVNPFINDGLISLFRIPAVQAELKLTREQAELIFALQADLYSEYRNARRNPAQGSELPSADEVSVKGQQVANRVLAAILGPTSYQRLSELWLQRQGLRAINNDQFADKLMLSEEQRHSIRELVEKLSRDYGRREPNDADKAVAKEILTLLTPQQQEKWEQLLGEPFSFR